MLAYITVFIIIFFSGSPFTGIIVLFLLSIFLSFILGIKNSWLLIVLVLVYVGGIIIIFTYMTRVLRYSKISYIRLRWGVIILFFIAVGAGRMGGSTFLLIGIWPAISFLCETIPFLFFLVNYILLTLISVFIIISKEDGPIKIK